MRIRIVFKKNTETQYIKENTFVEGESYQNTEFSKKSSIILNRIGFLGRNTENSDGEEALSVYMAFDFGFEFEQTEPSLSTLETSAVSKSDWSNSSLKGLTYNLDISTNPSGADVFISGKRIGTTPMKILYKPGNYNAILM